MGHTRDNVPGSVKKCPAMLFRMMGMDELGFLVLTAEDFYNGHNNISVEAKINLN